MFLYMNKNINALLREKGITVGKKTIIVEPPYSISDIPQIFVNYFNPKPLNTDKAVVSVYITDYHNSLYEFGVDYNKYRLRVELNGVISYIDNLSAGDNEVNFGFLPAGEHWFSLQVIDSKGRESERLYNDLWVIDSSYAITPQQTYTITDADLLKYGIKNTNSTVVTDMTNTRTGLTSLLAEIRNNGYRKCILQKGTYRINKAKRDATSGVDSPIQMPSGLTLDLNGATIKLNPYLDTEYPNETTHLNFVFRNTVDSHLINGTLEGDWQERKAMGGADASTTAGEGEGCNNIKLYYGKYNSIENITVTNMTGYNLGCNFDTTSVKTVPTKGKWVDNVKLVDGSETITNGVVSCDFVDITTLLPFKYLCLGVYLGYGGTWGDGLVDIHFYDANKNFISNAKVYQPRRCRIPDNAKYIRGSINGTLANAPASTFQAFSQVSTKYFEMKNIKFVDNRTTTNPAQFQHLLIENCTWERSGRQLTPIALDIEDGWEQAQDLFIRNCDILERVGTVDIKLCAGLNHVVENCNNIRVATLRRLYGLTLRNNTNSRIYEIVTDPCTKKGHKVYNNELEGMKLTSSYTSTSTRTVVKNCRGILPAGGTGSAAYTDAFLMKECNFTYKGYSGSGIYEKCTITLDGELNYITSGCKYTECNFVASPTSQYAKFSFNALNVEKIYSKCNYNSPTWLASHLSFNNGVWNECNFNYSLEIGRIKGTTNRPVIANKMGDVQFNNCTFNDVVEISCEQYAYVQFNNCTFKKAITYNGTYTKNQVQFNKCIFN